MLEFDSLRHVADVVIMVAVLHTFVLLGSDFTMTEFILAVFVRKYPLRGFVSDRRRWSLVYTSAYFFSDGQLFDKLSHGVCFFLIRDWEKCCLFSVWNATFIAVCCLLYKQWWLSPFDILLDVSIDSSISTNHKSDKLYFMRKKEKRICVISMLAYHDFYEVQKKFPFYIWMNQLAYIFYCC